MEYLQSYDSAAHHFSKAIDALPYYHQAFFNRGLAYESLGEAEQAGAVRVRGGRKLAQVGARHEATGTVPKRPFRDGKRGGTG